MTKDDVRRMMSLVDEKYIDELTQAELPEDFEAAEVEHSIVQEAPRQGWRILAALAAAVVLCVPIGLAMAGGLQMMPEEQLGVGMNIESDTDWAAFVDAMSDEEIDSYFCMDFPETDPARDLGFTVSYGGQTDRVPFAGAYGGKFLWFDTQENDLRIANVVLTEDETGLTLSGERYLEIAVMKAEPYEQIMVETCEPVFLPQFEDVPFYGAYMEWENELSDGTLGVCMFRCGDVGYQINGKGLSKRELLKLVYEVLDSGATPESLDTLYQMELEEQDRMQAELEEAGRREPDSVDMLLMEDLAELNELDFCKGWIPQLTEIGSMTNLSMGCFLRDTTSEPYAGLTYNDGQHNKQKHYLTLEFHPEGYGALADFAFAPLRPDQWSMETITQSPYCTEGEEGLNSYVILVDWGECFMAVDAQCTQEEIEVLVNEMSDILDVKSSTVNKTDPDTPSTPPTFAETLAAMNEKDFCKNWIPQRLNIGDMAIVEARTEDRGEGFFLKYSAAEDHHMDVWFKPDASVDTASLAMEPVYPSWTMNTLNTKKFCQELTDSMNRYSFYAQIDDFVIIVFAECTPEEMEIFVDAMGELLELHYIVPAGSEKTATASWFYLMDMEALQRLKTFKDWIPDLRTIGNMSIGGYGYIGGLPYKDDDMAELEWRALSQSDNYMLYAHWYNKEYHKADESNQPVITPENLNMETLCTRTYCTDEGTVYHLEKAGAVHVYKYAFQIDLGEIIMTVDAECTPEEMAIFADAMAELYTKNNS